MNNQKKLKQFLKRVKETDEDTKNQVHRIHDVSLKKVFPQVPGVNKIHSPRIK